MSEIVNHCEKELARAGNYYNRGGLIAKASPDRDRKEINFLALSLQGIVRDLSDLISFERLDRRRRSWASCDPPERYCRILYDAQDYPHLPVLRGVTMQPYLRPDGSLVTFPGYDGVTGLYGLFDRQKFPMPNVLSRQANQAPLHQSEHHHRYVRLLENA